jgi:uncharacterized protein YjbI with pentapeptide repeats
VGFLAENFLFTLLILAPRTCRSIKLSKYSRAGRNRDEQALARLSERFSKATDLLNSSREEKAENRERTPENCLNGIKQLIAIARKSPFEYTLPVLEALNGYVQLVEKEQDATGGRLGRSAHSMALEKAKRGIRALLNEGVEGYSSFDQIHLTGAHLKGMYLKRARLAGAFLERAHLEEATLAEATLINAHLEDAYLQGSVLKRTSLEFARLDRTNLKQANLQGANLTRGHLERAQIEGANLTGVWLIKACLEGACLKRVNLKKAHLERACLNEANLEKACLVDAYLTGTHLQRANLVGANLKGVVLADTHLESANLVKANLQRALLEGAHLTGANLRETNLESADLRGADLSEVQGLVSEQIARAVGDSRTKLPSDIERPTDWPAYSGHRKEERVECPA